MNYPNPFTGQTTFSFRHTRPGNQLDIELTIFNLNGKYLLSYATTIVAANTHVPFLTWDGRDVNGSKLPPGIYPYTLRVVDEMGQESLIRQKLVLGY
jgi:flagellar hook assembly protein FlgD